MPDTKKPVPSQPAPKKPVPPQQKDAKTDSKATTGKPGMTDKDFASKRAEEVGSPLPAMSHTDNPVNAPAGAKFNEPAKEELGNKAGQPKNPKRSWE
jgi:hypothetical protein